jgi:hypothetical protein
MSTYYLYLPGKGRKSKPRYAEKEMARQPRSTPTLVCDADGHRDSHTLGRRNRGKHRRFAGASFADALMILFVVGPFGTLIATWPIALVQALKAIADVAECFQAQQACRQVGSSSRPFLI